MILLKDSQEDKEWLKNHLTSINKEIPKKHFEQIFQVYEQFAFDPNSGEIVAGVDKNGNLVVSNKIEIKS